MTTIYLNDSSVDLLVQLCELGDRSAIQLVTSARTDLKEVSDQAFLRLLPWLGPTDYGLALRCIAASSGASQDEKGKP